MNVGRRTRKVDFNCNSKRALNPGRVRKEKRAILRDGGKTKRGGAQWIYVGHPRPYLEARSPQLGIDLAQPVAASLGIGGRSSRLTRKRKDHSGCCLCCAMGVLARALIR